MTAPANITQRPAREELLAGSDQRLRVLIADHDGLARCMIRTTLAEDDRVAIVLTASDSREALELARYYHPTVMIIDTALPPGGAVQLIPKVLQNDPDTRILTISINDQATAIAALRAGAIGTSTKTPTPTSSRS